MLKQLEMHRQILYELSAVHLNALPCGYSRLEYLAGLRNAATGVYWHPTLSLQYPAERVSEALEACHEELFERLLEMPLASQEKDLTRYFETAQGGEAVDAKKCVELSKSWMPAQAPEYLKDLYSANQAALCELVQENRTKAR